MLDDLAERTGVPKPTLYGWIVRGKLEARKVEQRADGKQGRWLIQANQDTLNAIRRWRDMPARRRINQNTPDFRLAPATH